jgi:hypothetical protein
MFCTREKQPWCEFAESAEHGAAVTFLRTVSYHLEKEITILNFICIIFIVCQKA